MNQESIIQSSLLQKQAQEIEENLMLIERQIQGMLELKDSLNHLSNSNEKEILSNLGHGIHMKTNLITKELFVEVGSGVVVKKQIPEVLEILEVQVRSLLEAKNHLQSQLEICHSTLQQFSS